MHFNIWNNRWMLLNEGFCQIEWFSAFFADWEIYLERPWWRKNTRGFFARSSGPSLSPSFVPVSVSVSVSASVRVFRQMRRIMKTKRSQKWVVSRRQMGSRGPAAAAGQPLAVSEVAGRVTQFIRHPVLVERRQTKQAMAFGHKTSSFCCSTVWVMPDYFFVVLAWH